MLAAVIRLPRTGVPPHPTNASARTAHSAARAVFRAPALRTVVLRTPAEQKVSQQKGVILGTDRVDRSVSRLRQPFSNREPPKPQRKVPASFRESTRSTIGHPIEAAL